MPENSHTRVCFFGLSTCVHCQHIHDYLDERGITYDCYFVDQTSGEERAVLMRKVKKYNPSLSFPTVVIDGSVVIVGEKISDLAAALDELMAAPPVTATQKISFGDDPEVEKMISLLRPVQLKQGYHFNADKKLTYGLVSNLLSIKKKLGYMACPCRLHSGDYEKDKDIICPCLYRKADVEEYGVCFCGLYVSESMKDTPTPDRSVPERRPIEKMQ